MLPLTKVWSNAVELELAPKRFRHHGRYAGRQRRRLGMCQKVSKIGLVQMTCFPESACRGSRQLHEGSR